MRLVRMMMRAGLCALLGLGAAACDEGATTPTTDSAQPSASAVTNGAPKIVAAAPVHEFGKVKAGTVVEHVFKVRNVGKGPLKIARAKGS